VGEQSNTNTFCLQFTPPLFVGADNVQRQTKAQADIREPCNAAKHLVLFQKSFVRLSKREKPHKPFLQ
jgi:hypothetical protein